MANPELPDWLPGRWRLTEWSMTDQGEITTFPAGTGPIQMALTLAFTRVRHDLRLRGRTGPAGPGEVVSAEESSIRITLWPTNVPSLPATIARTAKGIVLEFSHTIRGNEPSDFKASYEPA